MVPKLRFINRVIRRLRQKYGQTIGLYTPASSTTDRDTGIVTRTINQKDISRALVLPATTETKHIYDSAYNQAGNSFSMGGDFDTSERVFLLDEVDVGTFEINTESWIIFDQMKFLISKITKYTDGQAFLLIAKATSGEVISEIKNKNSVQYLGFTETSGALLNDASPCIRGYHMRQALALTGVVASHCVYVLHHVITLTGELSA